MAEVTVGYFVTAHGFGHAARAAAVMERLGCRAKVVFEVVTSVPEWFFTQSLTVPWRRLEAETDVGLVQTSPVDEDLEATLDRLERFWRQLPDVVSDLCSRWRAAPPRLVVSDISPLGLAVGARLGVPSVLVESFTWDWIYRGYEDLEPRLAEFGARYAELAAKATLRVQCEPVCRSEPDALIVPPVARSRRSTTAGTRGALGIDSADRRPLVVFTMGGFGWAALPPAGRDEWLLATLGGTSRLQRRGNLVRLPDQSSVYPPDLVAAADVVVAKLGYSTVAECYRNGARLAFVGRERFRESAVLAEFVERHLPALELTRSDLATGCWEEIVARLLGEPRRPVRRENGAEVLAVRLANSLAGDL